MAKSYHQGPEVEVSSHLLPRTPDKVATPAERASRGFVNCQISAVPRTTKAHGNARPQGVKGPLARSKRTDSDVKVLILAASTKQLVARLFLTVEPMLLPNHSWPGSRGSCPTPGPPNSKSPTPTIPQSRVLQVSPRCKQWSTITSGGGQH